MSDWEIAPTKVNEGNIKAFAGIQNGYADGVNKEDPNTNIKAINEALAAPNLHPVAKKALMEAKAQINGNWEVAPITGTPSTGGSPKPAASSAGWEVAPAADTSKFKSGDFFEETKKLIPSMDDIKKWANSDVGDPIDYLRKSATDQGNAGLDIVGGLPGMIAGGAHGIYDAISKGDASAGLKTGTETMGKLMPTALMNRMAPGSADTNSPIYKAGMAPITLAVDALNAVPQGAGEAVNAMGYPAAAQQVTDAGKLAVMAGAGVLGAKGVMKGFRGKEADAAAVDAAAKLEALRKQAEVPAVSEASPISGTVAHADDFGVINPYNVGGHVDAAREGRPTTIDNPQGELFGGEHLNDPMRAPNDQGSLLNNTDALPYEKPGLELQPKTEVNRLGDMGRDLNQFDRPYNSDLRLVPKDGETPNMGIKDSPQATILDDTISKQQDVAREQLAKDSQSSKIPSEKEAAYAEMERLKQGDFSRMEAQKQLQFADAIKNIEEGAGPARRAFLDRANLDFQHLQDVVGDKSLMGRDQTTAMAESLARGEPLAALSAIAKDHPSAMYRNLATYLASKVDGIKVNVRPDSIIKHGERDITGFYDPATGEVTLSGLGATSPHTVLHELVHALTSQLMTLRPNDIRVKGMDMLYKSIKGIEKEFPGIVNVREFVAEAFSNPKFQEFLKGKRYDNRSVWGKFVDGVKNMLGLKPGIETQLGNALDHALDLGKQIMEASDKKTRADMLSIFQEAGMNNKLADLMSDKPKDVRAEISTAPGVPEVVRGIPGLTSAISDFTKYDKPISEIIDIAKQLPDISNTLAEKTGQVLQAGGLFESLKTRNPIVKKTFERISDAVQEYSRKIKENLTDPETGLKQSMRNLTADEKGEIHAIMMEHEGQRELSSTELAQAGLNEKQIAYYNKYRELSKQFFNDLNGQRAEMGLPAMDPRTGHMAGRFMGDFATMVFKDGKVIGRIAGSTKWELARAVEHVKKSNPEFEFGKQEYNGIGTGKRAGDRFGGLMEALNFLSKTDGDVGKLMESYRDFLQKDTINFRNTMQHAKDKVAQAGGIIGSEGNKPWLDAKKNAEEGMKSQLSYFERGYEWMAMQKAITELKPLLGDEEVVKQAPNAVDWAQRYINHALGRDQGKLADATNSMASFIGEASGLGHTNLMGWNSQIKHLVMQKFMGLGNIPFSLTQLMQPLQAHPAMITLLKARGLDFSAVSAQVKATETYMRAMTEGHTSAKLSDFERAAVDYADKMSVFDVKMADHTRDINSRPIVEGYNKLADLNITIPEHLTRGMSFLMYAHILKDAGIPAKDIFGAAENMTNMVMVDYRPIERPMGYAKAGWIGDLASTLTRYKHNQYSQMAFYAREGIRGAKEGSISASAPLATFVASSLAFGGVMGFFAYNEADSLYQMFREHVIKKPDTLNAVMTRNNAPELLSHGLFSMLGIDMTSRFSNANFLPNSIPEAVMPYGSAVWDAAKNTGRFVLDPASETKRHQLVKSLAPQSAAGVIENKWFTNKEGPDKNLYINGTDGPHIGEGRVDRTDSEMTQRAFGFRSVKESKQLANNYSKSQIEKSHKNIADDILDKIKYEAMDNTLTKEKLQKYASTAMKEHGDDTLISQYVAWSEKRKLTQEQQQLLKDAQGGYKGAFNIKANK